MPLPAPVKRDLEELMDAVAYLLATTSPTSEVAWILGDVGMGGPQALPFGYVSQINEAVRWYTAGGGSGGLGAGGPQGLDDWMIPVVITIAYQQHRYYSPVPAAPQSPNAFAAIGALPYSEQPGWRMGLGLVQQVKGVLRENITVGGFAATSQITESKPVNVNIDSNTYRAIRITAMFQQRRTRGT